MLPEEGGGNINSNYSCKPCGIVTEAFQALCIIDRLKQCEKDYCNILLRLYSFSDSSERIYTQLESIEHDLHKSLDKLKKFGE